MSSRASSLYSFVFFVFKWLFAISLFIWWRRKGDGVLATLLSQLQQQADKNQNQTSHPLISAVSFFRKVRGVFEWLLLVWWLAWIIPVDTLELDILTTALTWLLGGALVVNIINALSSEQSSGSVPQALRSRCPAAF